MSPGTVLPKFVLCPRRAFAWLLGAVMLASFGGVANGIPIDRDYLVSAWRKEHGLPENKVLCLLVDHAGYLWVGTRSGVARFDGEKFRVWSRSNEPAFVEDTCQALAEDRDGSVWVGTASGLIRIATNSARTSLEAFAPASLAEWRRKADVIASLLVTREGELLAGTHLGVFTRASEGGWTYAGLPRASAGALVTSLVESSDGAVWVGTTQQLFRRATRRSSWEPQLDGEPRTGCVFAMSGGGEGAPFLIRGEYREGGDRVVVRRIPSGWEPLLREPLREWARPMFLFTDAAGGIWLPANGSPLGRYDSGRLTSLDLLPTLGTSVASCLAQGREGEVWVGLSHSGLLSLRAKGFGNLTRRDGLPNENVWCLLEQRDATLWVGTDAGAVRLGGDHPVVLDESKGLSRNQVRALAEDRDGRVWIGTAAGLNIWDGERLASFRFGGDWYHTKIRCLCGARDGTVWIGTATGLYQVSSGVTNTWLPGKGQSGVDVCALLEDRQGRMWIGTDGFGVSKFEAGRIESFGTDTGLSSRRVWALCEDRDGQIWVGTDRGLARCDEGRFRTVTTAQGLPANLVNGLVEDSQGYFWVGHDAGVYRVLRSELEEVSMGRRASVQCVSYGEEDGLLSLETNGQKSYPPIIRLRNNRIAIATTAGVALGDSARPPDLTNGPIPRIVAFMVGARDLGFDPVATEPGRGADQRLSVPAALGRQVEFRFGTAAFHRRAGLRLEYRLLGLDPRWYDARDQRRVAYPLMASGAYVFELRAANAHGYFLNSPARLSFRLEPRFFERLTVRLSVGLVGGVLVTLIVRWRVAETRRMHRLEYEAGVERERGRLARDLHDGLGSRLTEINLLSGQLGDPDGVIPPGANRAATAGELLRRRSAEAIDSLRELIWATNPKADTLESLALRLCDQTEPMVLASGMRCRFDVPDDYPDVTIGPTFRRNVLLAVREAVSNAVRHAEARELVLRIIVLRSRWRIEVCDDGRGFDPERATETRANRDGGLGLPSIQARIVGLGGTFHISSQPGAGTTVTLDLPRSQG